MTKNYDVRTQATWLSAGAAISAIIVVVAVFWSSQFESTQSRQSDSNDSDAMRVEVSGKRTRGEMLPATPPPTEGTNQPLVSDSTIQESRILGVFMEARTPLLARRQKEQGFPKDFDYRSWNRLSVDAAADKGDLEALNKRAVLRLWEGREDWVDHEPLIRGSGFYARLRAAEAWGLISSDLLNNFSGHGRLPTAPMRNLRAGLAWELVTQYLGHPPIHYDLDGALHGPHALPLRSVGFADIVEAEEMALEILRLVNSERHRRGWPPLRAQWVSEARL